MEEIGAKKVEFVLFGAPTKFRIYRTPAGFMRARVSGGPLDGLELSPKQIDQAMDAFTDLSMEIMDDE